MVDDLTGKRIGRLMVLSETRVPKGRGTALACVCQCDCGVVKTIRRDYLISGRAMSCGCYRKEAARKATTTHGLSKGSYAHHPLYDVWSSMIQRCSNPKDQGYKDYGGRGIKICQEWRSNFSTFYQWAISFGYESGKQIDRINVNGDYTPSNCRWVNSFMQARNKRNNVVVDYMGTEMCLQDVSNITGIPRTTLLYRYKHNKALVK